MCGLVIEQPPCGFPVSCGFYDISVTFIMCDVVFIQYFAYFANLSLIHVVYVFMADLVLLLRLFGFLWFVY